MGFLLSLVVIVALLGWGAYRRVYDAKCTSLLAPTEN
jgi:hypothetical protein